MQTYTVHEFEIRRSFFYTGNITRVKAGNKRGAANQVARMYGGTVGENNSVNVPSKGLGYDIFIEKDCN